MISLILLVMNSLFLAFNLYFVVNGPYPYALFNLVAVPISAYAAHLMYKPALAYVKARK